MRQALGFVVSGRKGVCPQVNLVEVTLLLRSLDKGWVLFSEDLFTDRFTSNSTWHKGYWKRLNILLALLISREH